MGLRDAVTIACLAPPLLLSVELGQAWHCLPQFNGQHR